MIITRKIDVFIPKSDKDLRDDAAMEALQLNPEAHERYQQAFNEAEQEQMQVAVSQLSKKFNVKPF